MKKLIKFITALLIFSLIAYLLLYFLIGKGESELNLSLAEKYHLDKSFNSEKEKLESYRQEFTLEQKKWREHDVQSYLSSPAKITPKVPESAHWTGYIDGGSFFSLEIIEDEFRIAHMVIYDPYDDSYYEYDGRVVFIADEDTGNLTFKDMIDPAFALSAWNGDSMMFLYGKVVALDSVEYEK